MRYLLILFCWFLSGVANAGVGDIDAREYVNWSESPYNRFVYFESGGGVCTAQYVGRDVILTARHCVDDDGFTVGSKYRITLHDGSKTYVTLEKYGPTKNEDWALLRVNDSNFYMDSYFDVSATEQYIHIENTGFGYMRILSDEEIKYIKQVFTQVKQADKTGTRSFDNIMSEIMPKLTQAGIKSLIDFACDDLSKEECWRFKLKSDKTCSISEYWDYEKKYSIDMWRTGGYVFYDYVVPTTCDSWGGNSGGAYFINNTISYRQLANAMYLGKLGQQFVLKSKKAFEQIKFIGCEIAKSDEWYAKKVLRDRTARRDYFDVERNHYQKNDLYIMQIINEEMNSNDPRLR